MTSVALRSREHSVAVAILCSSAATATIQLTAVVLALTQQGRVEAAATALVIAVSALASTVAWTSVDAGATGFSQMRNPCLALALGASVACVGGLLAAIPTYFTQLVGVALVSFADTNNYLGRLGIARDERAVVADAERIAEARIFSVHAMCGTLARASAGVLAALVARDSLAAWAVALGCALLSAVAAVVFVGIAPTHDDFVACESEEVLMDANPEDPDFPQPLQLSTRSTEVIVDLARRVAQRIRAARVPLRDAFGNFTFRAFAIIPVWATTARAAADLTRILLVRNQSPVVATSLVVSAACAYIVWAIVLRWYLSHPPKRFAHSLSAFVASAQLVMAGSVALLMFGNPIVLVITHVVMMASTEVLACYIQRLDSIEHASTTQTAAGAIGVLCGTLYAISLDSVRVHNPFTGLALVAACCATLLADRENEERVSGLMRQVGAFDVADLGLPYVTTPPHQYERRVPPPQPLTQ